MDFQDRENVWGWCSDQVHSTMSGCVRERCIFVGHSVMRESGFHCCWVAECTEKSCLCGRCGALGATFGLLLSASGDMIGGLPRTVANSCVLNVFYKWWNKCIYCVDMSKHWGDYPCCIGGGATMATAMARRSRFLQRWVALVWSLKEAGKRYDGRSRVSNDMANDSASQNHKSRIDKNSNELINGNGC